MTRLPEIDFLNPGVAANAFRRLLDQDAAFEGEALGGTLVCVSADGVTASQNVAQWLAHQDKLAAGSTHPPPLGGTSVTYNVVHAYILPAALATLGWLTGNPLLVTAKAVILSEVERLHWRIWNGKAKNARKSIERIRPVMHLFRGDRDNRRSIAPSSA